MTQITAVKLLHRALLKDDLNIINGNYTMDTTELILAHIGRISPGNDDISYWLYRDCASQPRR